jgi:signal transduction histidine kinase
MIFSWLKLWRCCCQLIFCSLMCAAVAAQEAATSVIKFDQALVAYSTSQDAKTPDAQTPTHWQSVSLPDSWIRHTPARQGVGYYRLNFDALPVWQAQERLILYIPRAGNRFSVNLNGRLLGATGDLSASGEDHVNVPYQFSLPIGVLHAKDNVLMIQVHGELARYAGLSEVWLGPSQVIRPMHASRTAWQSGGALVIVCLALIIGVLASGFGLAMGARVQIMFGLAAIFWGIRNTYALVTVPPLPHPWWGIVMDLLYGNSVVLMTLTVLRTLREKNKLTTVAMGLMLLTTLTMPIAYGLTGIFTWRQYWLLSLVSGVALAVSVVVWHWWRIKNFESNTLFVSALFALSLAVYDHLAIVYLPSGFGNFALARFAFLFILLALSVLLMRRILRSINAAKRFRLRLQTRLARAGALISDFHEEREKKRVQEAELAERLRLLREMHDGVGSHLVTLHSMLRNPDSTRQDLENQVTQAGLALRESLDALHTEPQTWLMVLVKLRDTMESRLKHAGIGLSWQVQDPGELPLPSLQAQRSFRLLLTECVTNVIKHAGASQVSVQAWPAAGVLSPTWVVRLCDDGCGLEERNLSGYGLTNMQAHAHNLHAQLRFVALAPGTCVEIAFG